MVHDSTVEEITTRTMRDLTVEGEPRRVLVARAIKPSRLDRDRHDRMRKGDYSSPINVELLAAIAGSDRPVDAVIFDNDNNWGFDEGLDDEELAELGYHMTRSQLALYRNAARSGVRVVVGVGFGSREVDGYTRGGERVVEELERAQQSAAPSESSSQLDLWLIDHLTLWTTAPLEEFLDDRLPEVLHKADRSRRQLERLLQALEKA